MLFRLDIFFHEFVHYSPFCIVQAANELKLATGPYKAARDAYVAATATYTKSLYE